MEIKEVPGKEISDFIRKHWYNFYKERGIQWKEQEYFFSAEENGQLIGAAILKIKTDIGELESLIVKENFKRGGVGTSLLKKSEEKARQEGCKKMVLETSEIHEEALKFYISQGYKVISEIGNLYYDKKWYKLSKEL